MDESHNLYAQRKPHTKAYIPYDFIYMEFMKGHRYWDSRSMMGQGLEVREEDDYGV